MKKAVIFDLGNVLVFFDHQRMIEQIAQTCKLSLTKVYDEMIIKQIGIHYELGIIETEEVYAHLRKLAGFSIPDEELFDAIGDIFQLNFEMEPILQALRQQKLRLIILSNTCKAHIEMIRRKFSILDQFDEHIFSYEVKMRKPDPGIFRKAIDLAGCSPNECFYTDDILEYVQVARELGLDAEQFMTAELLQKHLLDKNIAITRI